MAARCAAATDPDQAHITITNPGATIRAALARSGPGGKAQHAHVALQRAGCAARAG